ncbi:hypothetical protein ACOMHN_032958 [Nucella lapillus]
MDWCWVLYAPLPVRTLFLFLLLSVRLFLFNLHRPGAPPSLLLVNSNAFPVRPISYCDPHTSTDRERDVGGPRNAKNAAACHAYTRDQLLAYKQTNAHLNPSVINRLKELSIGYRLPRHRSCRGGTRKLRQIPVVVSQRRSQDNTLFLPDCVPCTTPTPPSSPDMSLCSTARPSRANLQNLIKVPLQSSDLPNQFCVCLFNAKSVGVARKRTAIADFLADHDMDVMVLTETWLKESGDESKIADLTPPGYKLFSFPRQLTASIKDTTALTAENPERSIQTMRLVLWRLWTTLMTGLCLSTALRSSAVCPRHHQPYHDTRDNAASYVTIIDELVEKLEWSRIVVIMEKSAAFDVDPIICRLHENCISTSLVERDVITVHDKNTSSRILTDDVFQSLSASSEGGCSLVLGSDDFVRQLFHERQGYSTALGHVLTVSCTAALGAVTRHSLLPNLHQGLSGRTLRVVVRQHPILVSRVDGGGGGGGRRSIQGYQGAFIDLIEELSLRLNFSYRLQEPPDESWGQLRNGRWDGMIGVLTREEADLAVGPFRALNIRAEVADYTKPYGFEDTVLLYRDSHGQEYGSFYIRPLQLPVYVALGVSMLCVLLLTLLARWVQWWCTTRGGWSQAGSGARKKASSSKVLMQWLMTDLQSVIAGLLNRSHGSSLPLPRTGQVVMVTWLFVSLVVVSGLYSSQLTASLTVRDNRPPFTSMEELVHQHAYTWGISNGTATQTIVMKSQHPIYSQFYEGSVRFSQVDPEVFSPDQDVQLRKVLEGGYAYLSGLGRYMDYWQSIHCHLQGFRVHGLLKPAVFYLQKHSPYTQLFSDT